MAVPLAAQAFAKELQAPVQVYTHRVGRHARAFGDLGARQALDQPHDQGLAVRFRQIAQGPQGCRGLGAGGRVDRKIVGLIGGAPAPRVIGGAVARHRQQPAREGRRLAQIG
jgi:hypothetical protein